MCGNCRAIVAGAFVVGTAIGYVLSSLVLDKKYRETYEEEAERVRRVSRRTVEDLTAKLERMGYYDSPHYEDEDDIFEEEDEFESTDNSSETNADPTDDSSETKSENFPEGNSEKQTELLPSLVGDEEAERLMELPQTKNVHVNFCKQTTLWTNEDGAILTEQYMTFMLGKSVMTGVYDYVRDHVKDEMVTMYAWRYQEKELWHIDIHPVELGHVIVDDDGT